MGDGSGNSAECRFTWSLSVPSSAHASGVSASTGEPKTWVSQAVLLFFDGLARGDDLPPLLRYIRSQLRSAVKEVPDGQSLSPLSPRFGHLRAITENLHTELHESDQESRADLGISQEDKLLLRRAARMALFFSIEADEAQDEAMRLLCEPLVARVVDPTPIHGKYESLSLLSEINYLLSDRIAVSNARRLARKGHWVWGLQLLSRAIATPMVTAAAAELFGHAGRWETSLQCLFSMSPATWTEVEVSAALRGLYLASREHPHNTMVAARTPAWWSLALRILALSREHGVRLSTPSAVNDTLGMLRVDGQLWVTACRLAESMLLLLPPNRECSQERTTSLSRTDGKVQPNVVSIYQMCCALRKQWYVALYYASLMLCQGDICISEDREVTHRLLRLCISGNRWAEALRTIQHCMWRREHEGIFDGENCVDAAVFLDILRVLNESQKAFHASRFLQQSQLSKHFSRDVTGKAYNIMLRHSATFPEACSWLQTMRSKNALVENESHEHLVVLGAREGDWKRALSSLKLLLDDPRRRYLYVPSAKVHDAVQYALERAPPPGPSWEVSLNLFTRMCTLQVPISEVAFQSTVKKCFAHGMCEQAQAIFHFVMRRGIQR